MKLDEVKNKQLMVMNFPQKKKEKKLMVMNQMGSMLRIACNIFVKGRETIYSN